MAGSDVNKDQDQKAKGLQNPRPKPQTYCSHSTAG